MRWLSVDEQRAWLALLTAVEGLHHAVDSQLQRDVGISGSTYAILAALSASPTGSRHMVELAGIAGHSQSRLSHAVTRLERDGLIRREACVGDRRAVHAVLTESGRATLQRAAPGHVALVRELVFDRLTPSQTSALTDVMTIVRDALVSTGAVPGMPALPQAEATSGGPPAERGDG